MTPSEKITHLRDLLRQHHIDAWIVPSADPHHSEYVAEHWQTRAWLSGFSGSAGTLVVTQSTSGLWTDPRYHIRARQELAGSGIELFRMGLPGVPNYPEWLAQKLPQGSVVGFDGSVFSVTQAAELADALSGKDITFAYDDDLVGRLWSDRPTRPQQPVFLLDESYSGESRPAKLRRIREEMRRHDAEALLLVALDDIAWTFNLRGDDIPHNPVAISYALITPEEARLFIDPAKVPSAIAAALAQDGVQLSDYAQLIDTLAGLPSTTTVLIDPEQTSIQLRQVISDHFPLRTAPSIPRRLKALKNETELAGIRLAHRHDGAAVVRWLHWLDTQGLTEILAETHTEITLGEKLTEFRQTAPNFHGPSFGNIVGYGPDSAVGHYSADPATTPTIRPQGLLLVDSGAHYLNGTTDITRTITLGSPTAAEKQAYTTVLQCLITLSTTRFPEGTTGGQLDALARRPLWQEGWNCRHGIGHGVGHFLNVHEGPQRLSPNHPVAIQPGMVLTNEPGVYFEGQFGVRLENILVAQPAETTAFGSFMRFETVTLCPFDWALVDVGRLSAAEVAWLAAYHQTVLEKLAPLLTTAERDWLQRKIRPLSSS